MKKSTVQIDHSEIEALEPNHGIAAKDNWQQMNANKKTMRQRRNRKRNYAFK